MEIKYLDYTIKEDGSVFLNETPIATKYGKKGEPTVVIDNITYRLEYLIAKLLFDIYDNTMFRISVGHVDCFKGNNSFDNIKIYSVFDKKNKSGKSISLYDGKPYMFSFRTPIYECDNVLKLFTS